MAVNKKKQKPRATTRVNDVAIRSLVDFRDNDDDWLVVQLAKLGVHQSVICAKTGFTPSQVAYRVRQAQVKSKDYRDGDSREFRRVWALVDEIWSPKTVRATRSTLEKTRHNLLEALKEARALRLKKTKKAAAAPRASTRKKK